MIFQDFDESVVKAAVDRFVTEVQAFAGVMLVAMVIAVFFRESFVCIPLVGEAAMIVWFAFESNVSKVKKVYCSSCAVAVVYFGLVLLMESELGLDLFKLIQFVPLLVMMFGLLLTAWCGNEAHSHGLPQFVRTYQWRYFFAFLSLGLLFYFVLCL